VDQTSLVELTADIVSAHVANNRVSVGDIAGLVQQVHDALAGLGAPAAAPEPGGKVAVVSIRASIKPDYLICMECGKKQKTLKRHLQTAHGMTPDQYRADYGLPKTYPMTSADYSARRGEMARAFGLGRKRTTGAEPQAATAPSKPRRGRKPKAGDASGS
jgi:predicted transcriptional regulator